MSTTCLAYIQTIAAIVQLPFERLLRPMGAYLK